MPLLTLAMLAGCAGSVVPPSLDPRAVELLPEVSPPRPDPEQRPAGAALTSELAALVARAQAAERAVRIDPSSIRRLQAGLAAAPESEAWIAAQAERSAIERARGEVGDVFAELEALLQTQEARLAIGDDAEGLSEIRAAQATVAAMLERQNAVFAEVR